MFNFEIWLKEFELERRIAGISKAKICKQAGLSETIYFSYMSGKRKNPRIETLNKLRFSMDSLKKEV